MSGSLTGPLFLETSERSRVSSRRVPIPVELQPAVPSSASVSEIRAALRSSLRSRVRPELYESWLSEVELIERDGSRFVFRAPSPFIRDWVRRNFLSELQSCLENVVGRRDVHVVLRSGSQPAGDVPLGVVDVAASGPRVSPGSSAAEGRLGKTGPERDLEDQRVRPDEGRAAASWLEQEVEIDGRDAVFHGRDPLSAEGRADEFHGESDVSGEGAVSNDGFARDGFARADASSSREMPARGSSSGRDGGTSLEPAETVPLGDLPRGSGAGRSVVSGGSGARSLGGPGAELNRNYTFETFVVGPCNRLSHAAALAVGDNPGRAYNPFFVHGNVGLGKTHVLQAVCHSIRRRNEDATVLYLSCEDFTNRFIHAIQRGELDKFREIHRGVDVLVIDDIQFLENKEKTQDEFFHTFNALYNTNRQIILSSDRPPSDIPTIEERLVSRFKWGLVAEMEVPCFETRVAIVKRKARLRQVEMPDEVAWFIAERIDTNIRELEGAVIKVVGISSITERPLTVELAEEALRGVVVSRTRKLSLGDVMGVVTGHFSVSARELTGKGRTQAVSLPRQICMYLCRQHTEQSLEEIGRFFGNRDHTTVIYAVQKIKKRVKEDRVFRELVGTLSSRLSG